MSVTENVKYGKRKVRKTGYQFKLGQWGAERPTVPLILSRFNQKPENVNYAVAAIINPQVPFS